MMVAAAVFVSGCEEDEPEVKKENPKEEKTVIDSTNNDTGGDTTEEGTDTNTHEKIDDKNAGTFQLTNISTGEEVTKSYHQCFVGDTIKVTFMPKSEYAAVPFDVRIDEFTKIKDNLFVATNLKTDMVGRNLNIKAVYDKNDSTLSANTIVSFFTYVEEADVEYTLNVSPDLLEFVDVVLEYTDERGHVGSQNISDEDWIRETTVLYEYENDKGGKMWTHNENPGNEWTKVGEKEQVHIYYDLNLHYDKLDQTYTVKAIYITKQNLQVNEDSYYLSHSLKWGPAIVAGAKTTNISISIGGNNNIKREDVAAYLEKLSATPDELAIFLNKRKRSVTEKRYDLLQYI